MEKTYFSLAVFAALVIWFAWALWPTEAGIVYGGWWPCLEFVGEGTLYGGQAYCSQGPVIYYVGYLVEGIFNDEFYPIMLAIGLASTTAIFLVMRKILIKQGIYHPLLYPLFFTLMVYRLMLDDTTSTLATAFYIIGFYYTFKKGANATLAAALAFTAAIFTKYTTILPILLTVAYQYVIKEAIIRWHDNKRPKLKWKIGWKTIKNPLIVVATIISAYLILNTIFPNLRDYTVSGHTEQLHKDIPEAMMKAVGKMGYNNVAAIFLTLLLTYCILRGFYDRETLVYPLAQVTIVVFGSLLILQETYGGQQLPAISKIGSYYMLPAYPMLLGAMLAIRKRSHKLFTAVVLVTLIHPSIYGPLLSDEKIAWWLHDDAEKARNVIEYGLHFIPPQGGYVLIQGPRPLGHENVFREYDIRVDPKRVTILNGGSDISITYPDPDWFPRLKQRLDVSSDEPYKTKKYELVRKQTIEEIVSGRYSLIMWGPPTWDIMGDLFKDSKAERYMAGNYCPVYTPNYLWRGEGKTYTTLIFINREDCKTMKRELAGYYKSKEQEICKLGYKAQQTVKDMARMNRLTITYDCHASEGRWGWGGDSAFVPLKDIPIMMILYIITYYALLMLDINGKDLQRTRKSIKGVLHL